MQVAGPLRRRGFSGVQVQAQLTGTLCLHCRVLVKATWVQAVQLPSWHLFRLQVLTLYWLLVGTQGQQAVPLEEITIMVPPPQFFVEPGVAAASAILLAEIMTPSIAGGT